MIDVDGQPFHDPEADAALFAGLKETLGDTVEVHERRDEHQRPGVCDRDGRPAARADPGSS